MATATPAQQTAITNLYIALFNRAPDASGFEFWSQGLASGVSLPSITAVFLGSPEAAGIYPASQSATAFVTTFYQTVFGRAPDAGGLTFWTGELNAAGGVGSMAARAALVWKIIEVVSTPLPTKPADLSDAQYADTVKDRDTFGKKVTIGLDFALNLKSEDLVLAKQVIANVNAPVPPSTPTVPDAPTVFTLTLNFDTFTGGTANDSFNAPLVLVPIVGNSATLNSNDVLDGGGGTDTLNAALINSTLVSPTLKNIEVIRLTTSGNGGTVLDLANATGVTHAGFVDGTLSSSGTIRNVGNASLSVENQRAAAAFTGSSATTLSLTLTQVGIAGSPTAVNLAASGAAPLATTHDIVLDRAHAALAQTILGAAVTTVNVTATDTNVLSLSGATAATVQTLAVTGTGSVDLSGQALLALKTVTAGDGGIKLTSTGTTALTVTTGAGKDTITAAGASVKSIQVGAGNDVVSIAGALAVNASIDLGDGDDTLILSAPLGVGGWTITGGAGNDTLQMNTTDLTGIGGVFGFEVLALGASGTTVDAADVAGIGRFAVVNTGTTTFNGAQDTMRIGIDNSSGVTAVNIVNGLAQTLTDITLTNAAAVAGAKTLGTLALGSTKAISLTSLGTTGNANVITSLTQADDATITIKGDTDLTITNALAGSTLGSTVDANAFTGKLSITGSGRSDTITGGAGDDIIDGGLVTQGTAAVTAAAEVATLTANAGGLAAGASITVANLTFTAHGSPLTRAQVAQVFADLTNGAMTGSATALGSYTGTLTGYDTSSVSNNTVTFTSTVTGNVSDLAASGTGAAAAVASVVSQGRSAAAAVSGTLDTLTGGDGADTFVFSTPDANARGGAVTTIITDFAPGVDKLKIVGSAAASVTSLVKNTADPGTLDALLSIANSMLNSSVQYYLGQIGNDSYVVTDIDGNGYTNVIQLSGVAVTAIQASDFIV
ncbi:DUF4214 domain-containing protein [Pigmentiphaga aceris]|nr:DUF4214 domain-containing protein [Pigmentiphaga aceris]